MWLSAIFCAPAIVASVWQKFRVVWYNRVSRTEKVSWEWNYVCCRCRGGVQHVHLSKVLVHISASLVSTMVGKLWALCFPSSFSCSALSLSPNPTHNANPNKLTSTLILTLILTMTLRPNQAHLGLPWNNDHNGSLLGNMSLLWQPLYSPTQNSSFWMIDEDGRLANRDADKMNKELQAEFKHKPLNPLPKRTLRGSSFIWLWESKHLCRSFSNSQNLLPSKVLHLPSKSLFCSCQCFPMFVSYCVSQGLLQKQAK